MIVRLERRGPLTVGLRIGNENVRQFFPTHRPSIDLEFGDLHISCHLEPEFWGDEPCILDPRLGDWLEAKRQRIDSSDREIVLALTPTDAGFFRLYLLPMPNQSGQASDARRVSRARRAVASLDHAEPAA